MDNNPQGTAATASAKEGQSLHAGLKLSEFKAGVGRPSGYSAGDVDMLRKVAQAFLNIEIRRKLAVPDSSGVATASGDVQISNDKVIIELYDAPSTGTAFFNTTQSFTASCPAGTTGSSVTVAVAAGTIGSNTSQAVANSLALELATDRANNALVCRADYDGAIYQVIAFSDGTYLVLGQFQNCGGFYRPNMAVVDNILRLDVVNTMPFVANNVIDLPFACVSLQGGTFSHPDLVYVVGQYLEQLNNQAGTWQIYGIDQFGHPNPTFAPVNVPGSSPFVFGTTLSTYPLTISVLSNGNLVIGGQFIIYGTHSSLVNFVAIITLSGAYVGSVTAYNAGPAHPAYCAPLLTGFISWGYDTPNLIVYYNIYDNSGTLLNPAPPLVNLKGFASPYGVAPQSTGNIICAGGTVDYYGASQLTINAIPSGGTGTGIQRIIYPTGIVDTTFASYAGAGFNSAGGGYSVYAIAIDNTDRIYVAHNALYYNGTFIFPATLVRLTSSGVLDTTWPVISVAGNIGSYNAGVFAVIIDLNGYIVFAGTFTSVTVGANTYAANSIFRINPITNLPI